MFPEHPMDGPCFRDKPANFGIVRVNGNDIGGGTGMLGNTRRPVSSPVIDVPRNLNYPKYRQRGIA